MTIKSITTFTMFSTITDVTISILAYERTAVVHPFEEMFREFDDFTKTEFISFFFQQNKKIWTDLFMGFLIMR